MDEQLHRQWRNIDKNHLISAISKAYTDFIAADHTTIMVFYYFQQCFKFDSDMQQYQCSIYSIQNVDNSPTCSISSINPNEVYTMKNLFSSNKTVSTPVIIQISNIYNPWSFNPFGPIQF